MVQCDYVISINHHSEYIQSVINDLFKESMVRQQFSVLKDQLKLKNETSSSSLYIETAKNYTFDNYPSFSLFS